MPHPRVPVGNQHHLLAGRPYTGLLQARERGDGPWGGNSQPALALRSGLGSQPGSAIPVTGAEHRKIYHLEALLAKWASGQVL